MKIFLIVLDVLMAGFANFVLVNSFFEIKKNKTWFIYYIFYFLFVVPVLLDRLYSFPNYATGFRYGYIVMSSDPLVTVIYDLIISFIAFVFYYFLQIKKIVPIKSDKPSLIKDPIIKAVLLFVCVLPVLMFGMACVVSKRNPLMIFDLGWKYKYEQGQLGPEIFGYSAIERLTYISIVCCFLLLFNIEYKVTFKKDENGKHNVKRIILTSLIVLALLFAFGMCLLLEGKRSIYLYAGLIFLVVIIYKVIGKVNPWFILGFFILFSVAVAFVVIFQGKEFRSALKYGEGLTPYKYASLRIDFFRDQSLKFVIYCMLHYDEIHIVSYPFQSYLTEIFYLFPIVYLPIPFKCGYETYLTAAYLFTDRTSLDSMRVTNSGLDELCANFSLIGVLIYAAILFWLFKTLAKSPDDWSIILIACFILFMMYTTSYVIWFYEFAIGLYIIKRFANYIRKRKGITLDAKAAN